jgi:Uma2 family endonuclease
MSVVTQPNMPATGPATPEGGGLYRFGVDQYHRIAELGIIGEDEPVELLEGLLVTKMTKNPPHVLATGLVQDALTQLVAGGGWHVSVQDPVTTDESEPEPDVKVVRGARRDYTGRRVGPRDVALVVEISDTSIDEDRGRKKRIYARARIPIYWIVNLVARRLEFHDDPTGPADAPDYRNRRELGPDDEVPVVLDGREVGRVAVGDILP